MSKSKQHTFRTDEFHETALNALAFDLECGLGDAIRYAIRHAARGRDLIPEKENPYTKKLEKFKEVMQIETPA